MICIVAAAIRAFIIDVNSFVIVNIKGPAGRSLSFTLTRWLQTDDSSCVCRSILLIELTSHLAASVKKLMRLIDAALQLCHHRLCRGVRQKPETFQAVAALIEGRKKHLCICCFSILVSLLVLYNLCSVT